MCVAHIMLHAMVMRQRAAFGGFTESRPRRRTPPPKLVGRGLFSALGASRSWSVAAYSLHSTVTYESYPAQPRSTVTPRRRADSRPSSYTVYLHLLRLRGKVCGKTRRDRGARHRRCQLHGGGITEVFTPDPRRTVGRGPLPAPRAPESWSVAAVSPHSA